MASRSRKGGGGTNPVVWGIFILALIFGFFQIPYDPGVSGVIEILKSKSATVKEWVESVSPDVEDKVGDIIKGGGNIKLPSTGGDVKEYPQGTNGSGSATNGGTTGTNTTATKTSLDALNKIVVAERTKEAYNRDDWKHWNNVRACWTVREAVLARDAVAGSLVLKDKSGNTTKDTNQACEVMSGKWVDPYSGSTFTNPKDLDIDHMIPLKYAAEHGGQKWDSNKKQSYANSMETPTHLLAVSAKENRSKSDKGPGNWKPSDKNHYCSYAKNWISISSKWSLSASTADVKALKEMLSTCK